MLRVGDRDVTIWHIGHRAVGTLLLGLLIGACDGIWDLEHLAPPPLTDGPPPPDGPPPDGAGELGFKNRKLIAEISSTYNDGEPSFPEDITELYFKSDRPGGLGASDIWRSTRATVNDPWSAPLDRQPRDLQSQPVAGGRRCV